MFQEILKDPGVLFVVVLSVFLLVWYIAANTYNRNRGVSIYRWLRKGMERLGEITNAQWISSSGTGAKIILAKANPPFKKIEVIYLLETREIFPYWIINHIRGRRDEVYIKAILRKIPKIELIVRAKKTRKSTLPEIKDQSLGFEQIQAPQGFLMASRGQHGENFRQDLFEIIPGLSETLESLTLQKESPQLLITAKVKNLLSLSPELFFTQLKTWLEKPINSP